MERGFESDALDENIIANARKMRFLSNTENDCTVGMQGDEHVKYADFISGYERITMMVSISDGRYA